MEKNIIDFIQRFYVIESNHKNELFIRDIFEDSTENYLIEITPKVKFIWGKAQNITGVNLWNKEYTYIQKIIREVFRSKQSISFYKFIIDESHYSNYKGVTIPLKMIKDEFPNLYGEKLEKIITENTKKNE